MVSFIKQVDSQIKVTIIHINLTAKSKGSFTFDTLSFDIKCLNVSPNMKLSFVPLGLSNS